MAYGNEEQEIRTLLELYFEGETTLAQEEALRRFFERGDIPADLRYAQAMFAGFAAIGREGCGTGAYADKTEEHYAPQAREEVRPRMLRAKVRRIYMSVSIAAAMLAAAGITWSVADRQPTVYCYLNGEPVTNMETAERQAEMAMRILRGSAKASAEGLETAREAAGKPIERMGRAVRDIGSSTSADGEK